jgi:catechol 2,3-dioxygenase-like lactoylglutathione lyase family enzyme
MTVPDRAATDRAPLAGLQTGHVGLTVTDLERSVDVKRRVLGLIRVRASDAAGRRSAFLGIDLGERPRWG